MKHIIAFALLSAGITVSASAFAADAVVEAPMEPLPVEIPVFTWEGIYIGVQGGYLWGTSSASFSGANSFDFDPDGFIGGVYAGYNYQFANNVVLGIEADFNGSAADSDRITDSATGDFASSDLNWVGTVRARLGYSYDRFLPYIAGGLAYADYEHNVSVAGVGSSSYSDTYVGWTIGAGLEYAFTDNLTSRIEYRYTDFGEEDYSSTTNVGAHSVDLTSHEVMIGLAYKF